MIYIKIETGLTHLPNKKEIKGHDGRNLVVPKRYHIIEASMIDDIEVIRVNNIQGVSQYIKEYYNNGNELNSIFGKYEMTNNEFRMCSCEEQNRKHGEKGRCACSSCKDHENPIEMIYLSYWDSLNNWKNILIIDGSIYIMSNDGKTLDMLHCRSY